MTGGKVYLKAEYISSRQMVYTYKYGEDFAGTNDKVSPRKVQSIDRLIEKAVQSSLRKHMGVVPMTTPPETVKVFYRASKYTLTLIRKLHFW
jgi:hypothetical protein